MNTGNPMLTFNNNVTSHQYPVSFQIELSTPTHRGAKWKPNILYIAETNQEM